jgi:integrase
MELILEEARKLTKQPWVAPLIEFLIYSAFRLGEACRIRPKDVLWSTREVFMQTRKGGKVDIKVPVPQCASDVLKAFEPSWRMDAVFHVTPNQASSVLGKFHQNLLLRGVIEKPLRTHDYRHEGTSRLFELKNDSGQPLLTVPFIVLYTGHSSIDVLVKTYANVRNEDANKVLDTVGY